MTSCVAISVALFCLEAGQTWAQEPADTLATLKGLAGVYIYIEPLAQETEERGITDLVLGAEVELRLREAGIPILYATPEGEQAPGVPTLYLQVTTLVGRYIDECVYSIRLELTQEVRLARTEDAPAFSAATWSVGGIGVGGREWRHALIEDVKSYTDQFVKSYVAANPQTEKQIQ